MRISGLAGPVPYLGHGSPEKFVIDAQITELSTAFYGIDYQRRALIEIESTRPGGSIILKVGDGGSRVLISGKGLNTGIQVFCVMALTPLFLLRILSGRRCKPMVMWQAQYFEFDPLEDKLIVPCCLPRARQCHRTSPVQLTEHFWTIGFLKMVNIFISGSGVPILVDMHIFNLPLVLVTIELRSTGGYLRQDRFAKPFFVAWYLGELVSVVAIRGRTTVRGR